MSARTERSEERLLAGWGRTAPTRASTSPVLFPSDVARALAQAGPRGALPRGLGRSYGDAAQNAGGLVLDMTRLSGVIDLDRERGVVRASAGTSFDRLLRAVVPLGWFPPVTPGTRFVTMGGALAADVHGKNHHRDGSLAAHVGGITLVTSDGAVRSVDPAADPETFDAVAGGMGLAGVVLDVTMRLLPIQTSHVVVDTERASDLEDLLTRMSVGDEAFRYSVAWVDGLARGRHLGRGVLTRGDHARLDDVPPPARIRPLAFSPSSIGSVPSWTPRLLGRATARAFNEVWYRRAPREERGRISPAEPFFYPLDAVGSWSRLYGRRGFIQYQFVVPFGQERVLRAVLERLSAAGVPTFLAVLKRFGPGRGVLSFPIPGWTLALDAPVAEPALAPLLDGFDRLVADAGGRVYLAKDARLDPGTLAAMYPELDRWREAREHLDPRGVFRSDMDRRLRLRTGSRVGVTA